MLEHERASEIADSWLFEAWASRERAAFKLPPSALALEPGDTVTISVGGEARLLRVTDVGEHGVREIEARAVDPEVYGGVVSVSREGVGGDVPLAGRPVVEFLDLPMLRGDEPPEAGYVAAFQSPWPGGVAIYSSPETSGYALRAVADVPAVMGETLDELPAGQAGVIEGRRFRVEVASGELTSVSRLQLLAGRNVAALRNEAGDWEVLQFETATLVAPSVYELSGLLRGQGGTEGAMAAPLAVGAPFVLLSGGIAQVNLTLDELRLPLNWRFGPASRDIGDASYSTQAHTFRGQGMKPLSPVHVRARREDGDIELSWIRRSRMGGDSWDVAEVPLGEDAEHYEVDILNGDEVVRTISSTTPSAIYTAAEQVEDFGAEQSVVHVAVHQMSAVYGRGSAKRTTV